MKLNFGVLKHKMTIPLWGILVTAGLMLLVLILTFCLKPSAASPRVIAIPEGQTAIPVQSNLVLANKVSAGDIVRLYNAEGKAIPELQYVQVIGTVDGELLLLMNDRQTAAFITGFGDAVSLVLQGQPEKAIELLSLQEQIMDPELKLNLVKQSFLKPGESVVLNCDPQCEPEGGIIPPIQWKSSREEVATVADGIVTAHSVGKTQITATCGDVTASCTVTVSIPLDGIILNKTEATIGMGTVLELAATPEPADASDFVITWTSEDASVASVEDNGTVNARTPGTTVITASCGDVSASCTVTVGTYIEVLDISPSTLTMKPEETAELSYAVYPAEAIMDPPVWTSSDESVATVSEDGVVTAINYGMATITATCGSHTDICLVNVPIPW